MTDIETLKSEFVQTIEGVIVGRINARLRDLLALGLVAAPEAERAEMRRGTKAALRRPYKKSAKWHAAQRRRRSR